MTIVNPFFISHMLSPIIGGADSGTTIEKFSMYNSSVERDVKRLANEILLPEFRQQNKKLQKTAQDSLAFYLLNSDKINFESIFDSLLLPLDTPQDSKIFFQWIWEEFFNKNPRDHLFSEPIIEDFDPNGPINLLLES